MDLPGAPAALDRLRDRLAGAPRPAPPCSAGAKCFFNCGASFFPPDFCRFCARLCSCVALALHEARVVSG
jgi:hypothetical protein